MLTGYRYLQDSVLWAVFHHLIFLEEIELILRGGMTSQKKAMEVLDILQQQGV
jgi:hypothetical protein